MDTRTIGNFLKELRKEKGLTREQLGEEALIHAYGFTDCFGSDPGIYRQYRKYRCYDLQ